MFSIEAALSLTVVCSDADYITSMFNNKWRCLGEEGCKAACRAAAAPCREMQLNSMPVRICMKEPIEPTAGVDKHRD